MEGLIEEETVSSRLVKALVLKYYWLRVVEPFSIFDKIKMNAWRLTKEEVSELYTALKVEYETRKAHEAFLNMSR